MKTIYRSLKAEINIIQKQLIQQKNEISQVQKSLNIASPELLLETELEIDDDFVLPCSTYEMFQNLEEKLKNNKEFWQKIVSIKYKKYHIVKIKYIIGYI